MSSPAPAPSMATFVPFSDYDWGLDALGPLPWNPAAYCLTASFFAVSFWLVADLNVQVYFAFKKHHGLYFWSILAVIWGVFFHALGLMLKVFVPSSNAVFSTVVAKIGWILDTTGFSVVLYSRLHLVVRSPNTLRWVLGMIVIDAFLFHTPVIVLLIGQSANPALDWDRFVTPIERIQIIGFTLQESLISGIYVWRTAKFVQSTYSNKLRRVMASLIAVQVVVVLIDVAMITIDDMGYFTLKAIIHPFAYAIKLKVEFAVLNQLLNLVSRGRTPDLFLGDASAEPASANVVAPKRRISLWADALTFGNNGNSDNGKNSNNSKADKRHANNIHNLDRRSPSNSSSLGAPSFSTSASTTPPAHATHPTSTILKVDELDISWQTKEWNASTSSSSSSSPLSSPTQPPSCETIVQGGLGVSVSASSHQQRQQQLRQPTPAMLRLDSGCTLVGGRVPRISREARDERATQSERHEDEEKVDDDDDDDEKILDHDKMTFAGGRDLQDLERQYLGRFGMRPLRR